MSLDGGCRLLVQAADGSAYNGTGWGPTIDQISGVMGATGPEGPAGPAGPAGADGAAGAQGPPGADGAAGAQGNQGTQGIQGIQGIQGVAGPPGDVSVAWPVGAIFISVVATNPATLLGFGTWVAFGAGRMLVGFDAADPDFDVVRDVGGAKTHTLTTAEMPAHTHVLTQLRDATTGGAATNIALTADTSSTLGTKVTGSTGSGGAHNNLPPFITTYMWERTA